MALGETHATKSVGYLRRQGALKYGVVSFYGLGNKWEDYSNYFGEGAEISRNWATATLFFILAASGL